MNSTAYPAYLRLLASGQFDERIAALSGMLSSCALCPRHCRVDRTSGETGFCGGGLEARVASYGPHFGEESPLVGRGGSGTILFSGCNLGCCFCQNYEISHFRDGREISTEGLAGIMLDLQDRGCHNVNLVTPTHFAPQIADAVRAAAGRGLHIPLVYNCGGYEGIEALTLLDGIVDIYMPDFKFRTGSASGRYLNAPDYPEVAGSALREMHRQVGDLVIREGVALRGLLVRHLVMPGHLEDSAEVFRFLAENVSVDTFINVMSQYRPCYKSYDFPEIANRLTAEEHRRALALARQAGLTRICY
jgi:putative pyruvate formate lyase activating enzyme